VAENTSGRFTKVSSAYAPATHREEADYGRDAGENQHLDDSIQQSALSQIGPVVGR